MRHTYIGCYLHSLVDSRHEHEHSAHGRAHARSPKVPMYRVHVVCPIPTQYCLFSGLVPGGARLHMQPRASYNLRRLHAELCLISICPLSMYVTVTMLRVRSILQAKAPRCCLIVMRPKGRHAQVGTSHNPRPRFQESIQIACVPHVSNSADHPPAVYISKFVHPRKHPTNLMLQVGAVQTANLTPPAPIKTLTSCMRRHGGRWAPATLQRHHHHYQHGCPSGPT